MVLNADLLVWQDLISRNCSQQQPRNSVASSVPTYSLKPIAGRTINVKKSLPRLIHLRTDFTMWINLYFLSMLFAISDCAACVDRDQAKFSLAEYIRWAICAVSGGYIAMFGSQAEEIEPRTLNGQVFTIIKNTLIWRADRSRYECALASL